MKQRPALYWLVLIIVLLALFTAGAGLFSSGEGNLHSVVTARGEMVELWGQGLYQYDTPIGALGFTAGDLVTLVLAIPMLVISTILYRRGSIKGGLLLSGTFAYFLYTYASLGFGAAYNNYFLAYTVLFTCSLFGLILAFSSFDLPALPAHFGPGLPRKGIGIFLIVSGVILSLVWLALSILPALTQGKAPPEAYYYTTFTTGIIDLGLVAPALILAGVLILRRSPMGFLFASTMLIFTWILGASLSAAGIIQVAKDVITIGQAMAFTFPFVILSLVAVLYTLLLFRNFSETIQ